MSSASRGIGGPSFGRSARAVCALLTVALALGPGCVREERARVRFGDVTVSALVADEPVERDRGLQDHGELGPEEGMLFVWPGEGTRVFGIKGVEYPLDLVFMDGEGVVVGLDVLETPGSAVASSPARSRFVLEVPAGFVRRNGVAEGDRVELDGVE